MNGYKPIILLEEFGVPCDQTFIDFAISEQKTPVCLQLDPNQKIPGIEDRAEGRAMFKSGAILWHLAEKFGQFLSDDPVARSETLQWLFFQVGHVGPMIGLAMYFQRIAAPDGHDEPFSVKRYVDESPCLVEVLNRRLDGRDYLVGDCSIANMATYL